MKKLILALTMLGTVVHAEEWMETANDAGGKILFTQAKCDGRGRMVISTLPDGDTVHGCWYYFSDMVHVIWTDSRVRGKTSAFDPKTLAYKNTEGK